MTEWLSEWQGHLMSCSGRLKMRIEMLRLVLVLVSICNLCKGAVQLPNLQLCSAGTATIRNLLHFLLFSASFQSLQLPQFASARVLACNDNTSSAGSIESQVIMGGVQSSFIGKWGHWEGQQYKDIAGCLDLWASIVWEVEDSMHRWAVEHKIELESRNRGSGSHLVKSKNARDYLTSYPRLASATIQSRHNTSCWPAYTTVSLSLVQTFQRI